MTVQTKAKALEGKVALVTGGSRGIGRAISVAMAECGASVAIGFQTDCEAAEIAKQQIEARGGQCITIAADVSQAGETSRLIREVERSLGEVDVLVNNAGMARPRTIDTLGHGDWHETLAVNLTSVFFVTHAVLPGMRRRKWGANYQPIVNSRSNRWSRRPTLCGIEGGYTRSDTRIRVLARSRRNHRQRNCSSIDTNRHGKFEPARSAGFNSFGPVWYSRRGRVRGSDVSLQRVHHRPDNQR